jgi:hypothetical protein
MNSQRISDSDSLGAALAELSRLRQFTGAPAEFWKNFLSASSALVGASQAVLAVKKLSPTDTWQKMANWSANGSGDRASLAFARLLLEIAESCAQQGSVVRGLEGTWPADSKACALAVKLVLPRADEICIAAYLVPQTEQAEAQEALLRLQLVADLPSFFQQNQLVQRAKTDVEKFALVLDLLVLVNAEKHFLAVALAFCNGLASRLHCDRVSLGWLEKGFISLQAMSRTEKFDRNMAAVKSLELAMEEAVDQDEEVLWPAPEGASQITRDHAAFARDQGAQCLCSLPLRLDGQVVGAATCERQGVPFTETELKQLRLSCDLAARRLDELKRNDQWLGARLVASTREKLGRWVGPEHTWYKVLGVTISVALILLVVLRLNYRVEAKFILHSDEVSYVTAPFDGFIDEVPIRVGDAVENQQTLLSLDRKELVLEESAAIADVARYSREAEKARAARTLADMRIAEALVEQARARLELVRHRLAQSSLRAPFAGVLVEGEQRERKGAPVKQGEVLLKVASTRNLYLEAEVNERDVQELKTDATGQAAFASLPKLKFPMRIVQVQPLAQPKEGENVFRTRCSFTGQAENWWRPGMTGVAKIDVGKRSLLWIMAHRTMDYLRLLLWW